VLVCAKSKERAGSIQMFSSGGTRLYTLNVVAYGFCFHAIYNSMCACYCVNLWLKVLILFFLNPLYSLTYHPLLEPHGLSRLPSYAACNRSRGMLEIMASGYNLDMNFKASMCSWRLLKRGVSSNIGLICIELLIYIYI
jgi:hypothetical protein